MSRKQSVWVITVFFIVLLSSLIVSIPARQLMRFVELPAEAKIQGLQGTITDGLIKVFSYQSATNPAIRITEVVFEFQPLCLLKADVCYQFRSEDKELSLNIEANLFSKNISINQSHILLGSDVFKDIPQLLAQPKGQLAVHIETLSLVDSKISGIQANVDWLGAGIQGEDQLLGNYNALIKTEADKLSIKLGDKNSLLSVTGDINVNWNGQYDVDVKFESRPELNKSVISVLEMTSKRSGLNRFTLKKTGRVAPDGLRFLRLFESNV